MATTAAGVTIPGSSPTTTPATPIEDHWNDLGLSLNGKILVYVANATAAAAYLTSLAADGYTVSASAPAVVYRGDAPSYAKVEICTDGSTWVPLGGTDSGWTSPAAVNTGWDAATDVQSRIRGGYCELRGILDADASSVVAGTYTAVVTLASGHHPPSGRVHRQTVSTWVNGATPPYKASAEVAVYDDGTVTVYTTENTTGVVVDGVRFPLD